MAGRIPHELIDAILARIDIVDLIARRVSLRKAGKDFQARCPFHEERTPSFTVSREKQFYHCFGCGAHGTAIGFLMEYDRLAFREAVEELAQEAGVAIPDSAAETTQHGPDLRPLYDLLDRVGELYRQQLNEHPQAPRASDYLRSRGLSDDVIARFGIGYAPPGWDFLLQRLGRSPGDRERLWEAGLLAEQSGRRYDRFRDRIMFPIRDRRGRTVGFGGRVLGDQTPKYLNSPETPLFHKGRELYGLHEARLARRQLPRLLVVEGYMDAIALAQFDIPYAVATLGTAVTPEHLRQLLRSAPELVFCFDGDRAGRDAAWKALQVALPFANGRQPIGFLFLPEGEDPDTLIRRRGHDSFVESLEQATPLSEFLFEHLTSQVQLGSAEGRARLAWLAEPLLNQVPDGVYKQMLTQRLAGLVGMTANQPAASRGPARRAGPRRERHSLTPMRLAIALLVQQPSLADEVSAMPDEWRRLANAGVPLLEGLLEIVSGSPRITTAALLERWRGSEVERQLDRLSDPNLIVHIPETGRVAELRGAIQALNRCVQEQEAQVLFARSSPSQWTDADKERIRKGLVPRG